MYLVDTDVLSDLRKPRPDAGVARWIAHRSQDDLYISVITVMEIERGVEKQRKVNPQQPAMLEAWLLGHLSTFGSRVLPITSAIARSSCCMRTALQRDDDDLASAATALDHGLAVVIRNVRHFDKTGVAVFNPFDAP